jgi:hypothetical protein
MKNECKKNLELTRTDSILIRKIALDCKKGIKMLSGDSESCK